MFFGRQNAERFGLRGFSLIELLLAVVLVFSLLVAVAFSFSTVQKGAELDEGVIQVEALLRFARAQAANTGRKVQITFNEGSESGTNALESALHISWEPDPLGQPGLFEELPEGIGFAKSINDLVSVKNVTSSKSESEVNGQPEDLQSSATEVPDESLPTAPSIAFYPDGSCDSAQITVASRNGEDSRRTSIRLVGTTGVMRRVSVATDSVSGEEPFVALPVAE